MRTRTLIAVFSFLLSSLGLSGEDPIDTSLVQLIANPMALDGKLVRVIGFLNLEFEGDAVYLHKEDFEHAISRNAIWVDIPDNIKDRAKLSGNYVLLEGIFDAKERGHMGMFSGAIQKITRAQVWSTPGKARRYGLPKFVMQRVEMNEATFSDALDWLVYRARDQGMPWSFEYQIDLSKERTRVTFAGTHVSFEEALEKILNQAGLDYEITSDRKATIIEPAAKNREAKQ